jgi:hypothetical protein
MKPLKNKVRKEKIATASKSYRMIGKKFCNAEHTHIETDRTV